MELYSKEELLKELKKEYSCGGECDHCPEVLDAGSCSVLRCIRRIIDNVTPVETDIEVIAKDAYKQGYTDGWKERFGEPDERTQGEWTDLSTDGRHTGWIACSVCGQEPPNESNLRTNFCSYCGAKMRKGGKEEND